MPQSNGRPLSMTRLTRQLGARDNVHGATSMAQELLDALRGLHFCAHELQPFDQAVPALYNGPTASLLNIIAGSVRLLRSLPGLAGVTLAGEASGTATGEADGDLTRGAQEGFVRPPLDRFCEDMDATLEGPPLDVSRARERLRDVCEKAILTLKDCAEMLRDARREKSKWGLITAGEEGRRKTQKSLRTGLMLTMRLVSPTEADQVFPNDGTELQVALAVRQALMHYRLDMLGFLQAYDALPYQDLTRVVTHCLVRTRQLCAAPVYRDVRAADRFAIQNQFVRLEAWEQRPGAPAANIYDALQSLLNYVVALANVNRRGLLTRHDREVQARVLAELAQLADASLGLPAHEAWPLLARVLQEAQRMEHRNHTVDELVRQALAQPPSTHDSLRHHVHSLKAAVASEI